MDARYGRRVERVTLDRGGADVELDDGSGVRSRRLVAADGFPGVARRAVAAAAGPDVADRVADLGHHDAAPALQHFVSVAFESRSLAERLLAGGRAAMLYFVFNQKTISVVVAHDLRKGTFNLQYPFFPPAERGVKAKRSFDASDISSDPSPSLKSNSFSAILGPFALAFRNVDDSRGSV